MLFLFHKKKESQGFFFNEKMCTERYSTVWYGSNSFFWLFYYVTGATRERYLLQYGNSNSTVPYGTVQLDCFLLLAKIIGRRTGMVPVLSYRNLFFLRLVQ